MTKNTGCVRLLFLLFMTAVCCAVPADRQYHHKPGYPGYVPALSLLYGPTGHLPIPPPVSDVESQTSACPDSFECVPEDRCIVQCPPRWTALAGDSCVLPSILTRGSSEARSAAAQFCRSLYWDRDAVALPRIQRRSDLTALISLLATTAGGSVVWTSARWRPADAAWVWEAAAGGSDVVDFARLQLPVVGAPAADLGDDVCLVLDAQTTTLQPRNCSLPLPQPEVRVCQLAAAAARCDGRCCAVSVDDFPERPGCFVDDAGTRCERRVHEGYFPLDAVDSLVRVSTAPLDWPAARRQCRRDGGDLAVVNSRQFDRLLSLVIRWHTIDPATSDNQYYIGLSSDGDGVFTHVNGSRVDDNFRNFETLADATRPDACAYYSRTGGGALVWRTGGDCTAPRHFVCQIGPLRRHLSTPPAAPACGRRNERGVFGRATSSSGGGSGDDGARARFQPHLQPVLHPPFLPPQRHHQHGGQQFGFSDTRAQFGEISWQAAVWVRSGNSDVHQFVCGAALVDELWVLTSAGCVHDVDATNVTVTLGEWNLDVNQGENSPLLPVLARQVTNIRVSPDQVRLTPYGARPVSGGGVALLRLASSSALPPAASRPHISAACLPDASTLAHRLRHLRCVVTGWHGHSGGTPPPLDDGLYEQDGGGRVLRKLDAPVTDDEQCQHAAFLGDVAASRPQQEQFAGYGPPPFGVFPESYRPHPAAYPRSAVAEDDSDDSDGDEYDGSEDDEDPRVQSRGAYFRPGVHPLPPPPPPHYDVDPYGYDLYRPPPPPPPGRRLCLRDHRCIADSGAVLACTLPPPPPSYLAGAYPRPYSSSSATARASAGNGSSEATAGAALNLGERVLRKISAATAKVKRDVATSEEDVKTPASAETTKTMKDETPVSETNQKHAEARGAQTPAEDASADGRIGAAFPPLHPVLSAIHGPPPAPPGGHFGNLPPPIIREPASASTEHYDAYFVVGVAQPGAGSCHARPMVFDDVLSQLQFIRDTIARDQ